MASDVLFATDVHTLSDKAASRVEQVAKEIKEAASGGEVKVTGHTDDVGTDAYNMDLLKKRAGSVAEKLKSALGPSFTIADEGKGKSQSAVEGTDDAARAANRRVEIAFTASKRVSLSDGSGGSASIPDANTPVATGHNPVEYTLGFTHTVEAVDKRDLTYKRMMICELEDARRLTVLNSLDCKGNLEKLLPTSSCDNSVSVIQRHAFGSIPSVVSSGDVEKAASLCVTPV